MTRPGGVALWADAGRMAVGTLTVLPVRPPSRVDRAVAGRAMVLAPLVGLPLAVVPAGLLGLDLPPLPAAVLAVGSVTLLTRGLHLDGLADTADGLGSGRPAEQALEVMRRGDVGPFGVVALVLVLLVQVSALAALAAAGVGAAGYAVALVLGRLALPLACSRGVPSARQEGLGAAVAGTVPLRLAPVAVVLALLPLLGAVALVDDGLPLAFAPLGLGAGLLVGWRAVRRLGGVTGDVLGACVEAGTAGALVVMVLAL